MTKLLIILVIALAIVAVIQLSKIYTVTSRLRNKREEDISHADNRMNAKLMMLFLLSFFAFTIWLVVEYGGTLLPVAASEHGASLDSLMNFNLVVVFAVFFLVNSLLFGFASKYYYRKDNRATFFPHDNRLELIWTVIPSVFLFVIIVYGLTVWLDITDDKMTDDAIQIELYSKQFDWTARYVGADGEMGSADYTMLSGTNPVGIITAAKLVERQAEIAEEIHALKVKLEEDDNNTAVLSEDKRHSTEEKLSNRKGHLAKLKQLAILEKLNTSFGEDDLIIKSEFHIPQGREIEFVFRSQDVIHSAYAPHFRMQMNTVPGMQTRFKMTPTITTDSMRTITGNPDFNYILLCNKICGAAHYNMKMEIIVEKEEEYQAWLAEQKAFEAVATNEEEAETAEVVEL